MIEFISTNAIGRERRKKKPGVFVICRYLKYEALILIQLVSCTC